MKTIFSKEVNIHSHCLGMQHQLICCSLDYVEKQILAYLAIVQILTCQKKWHKKQKKKENLTHFHRGI